jgi:hypothetical protein
LFSFPCSTCNISTAKTKNRVITCAHWFQPWRRDSFNDVFPWKNSKPPKTETKTLSLMPAVMTCKRHFCFLAKTDQTKPIWKCKCVMKSWVWIQFQLPCFQIGPIDNVDIVPTAIVCRLTLDRYMNRIARSNKPCIKLYSWLCVCIIQQLLVMPTYEPVFFGWMSLNQSCCICVLEIASEIWIRVENHIMIPCDAIIVEYNRRVCLCACCVYAVSFLSGSSKSSLGLVSCLWINTQKRPHNSINRAHTCISNRWPNDLFDEQSISII